MFLGLLLASFLFLNLFFGPIYAFLPIYAKEVYGGSISTLALLETALGLGAVLGGLALSVANLKGDAWRRICATFFLDAVFYLLFCVSRSPLAGAAALGGLGFCLTMANIQVLTLFQTRPRADQVVTLMSWVNLISVASLPLSMSGIGIVLRSAGARPVAIACAATTVMLTGGLYWLPRLGAAMSSRRPMEGVAP